MRQNMRPERTAWYSSTTAPGGYYETYEGESASNGAIFLRAHGFPPPTLQPLQPWRAKYAPVYV